MAAIDPSFEVLARGPQPSSEAIERAVRLGASRQYADLVSKGADLELEHDSGVDVRIWAPDFLQEMDEVHGVSSSVAGVAIGDADGLFLIERVDGLFAVGAGALDPAELRRVADDLNSLLRGELGDLSLPGGLNVTADGQKRRRLHGGPDQLGN